MRKFVLAGLAAVATAVPAAADWQYTKWGMTPNQVAQASKGQLRPCDANCDDRKTAKGIPKLYGPYKTGDFTFTAYAIFDTAGKLASVLLTTKGDNGYALAAALRNKYGEPASKSQSAVMNINNWRDQKDQISLVMIGNGPTALIDLTYQPRLTDSNKGL